MEFDQMEFEPILATALDIYADQITAHSELSPMLTIECVNEEIKSILSTLYHDILNLDANLFHWTRAVCKYGDYFQYLDIDEKDGVRGVIALPQTEVERLEGEDTTNPNYVQFQWNSAGMTFENWQMCHYRILGNDKFSPYGSAILDPARRIYRQLNMLENAVMAYRIVRSPERRVFYIDVGNIAPQDIPSYMEGMMTNIKRNQVVDENTGQIDLRSNFMNVTEDYWIPVRGQVSGTKIDTLPGGKYTGDIEDIQYLRDKLVTAIKIPHSYLTRGEGGDDDKTSLAQKDLLFARTIQRIQRCMISEIEKIGIVHLYALGYRGEDLVKFRLKLQNPSKIAELQELEHWRTKFDVAAAATDGYFSKRWVSQKVFNISDGEMQRMQREQFSDAQVNSQMRAIAEPAEGMAPMPGGDLGSEEMPPGADLAMDEEPEPEEDAPEEDIPEDDDESVLLAAPAKRDDRLTTTPKSKGKTYLPVKHTGGDRRKAGARKQHHAAQYSRELSRNTPRNILPGMSGLKSVASGVLQEQNTNYDDEQDEMLLEEFDSEKLNKLLEEK